MHRVRGLLVLALLLVPPPRARGLRACLGLVVLGFIALCGHPRLGLAARPSNADMAFTQVPLLSPSGGTDYLTGVGHGTWPTFLDSVLVRAIGGSDSILIASTRTQGVRIGLNGSVTYTFPPHTFANRVGTIVTANDWTDPLDSTLPMLIASFTFEDGRTWGTGTLYDVTSDLGYPYLLYYRVRNWSDQVVPGDPDFVAKPLNPAVFQLCAQASNGGVGNVYSDLQTFSIPDTLRNTALHTMTFASHAAAFDSMQITSAHGLVTGCAVWPQFEITSRDGGAIVPQYQNDDLWATAPYGGYRDPFTGNIVGAYRTIAGEGCFLADLAMALTYVGAPMTVLTLNDTLQRSHGFEAERVCDITSVSGQAPGDTVWISKPPGRATLDVLAWTDFVIDRDGKSYSGALATLTVVDSTHAIIMTHPDTSLHIAPGQQGCVYRNVIVGKVATQLTAGCQNALTFDRYGPSRDPATAVEEALVDSLPSLMFVGTRDVPHWALATGWRPAFGSTVARGTYSLVDPDQEWGATSLLVRSGNLFGGAWVGRYVADTPQKLVANMAARTTQSGDATLTLWLTGEASLSLTEYGGGYIRYDAATGDYETNITGAFGVRSANPGTIGGSSGDDVPADMLVLPVTKAMEYSVTALASEGGTVSLTGTCRTGGTYTGHGAAGATLTSGGRGYFSLSVDPNASEPVGLHLTATVGVPQAASPTELRLRIVPTPSLSSPCIYLDLPSKGRIQVDVFDVAGRGVRRLADGIVESGTHTFVWDGHDDAGGACGAGVFFVRARTAGGSQVVRCVRVGP